MGSAKRRWAGLPLGLVALGLLLVACSGGGGGSSPASGTDSGGEYDFSVTSFEGEEFSLAEQRGTPVVINFWESW